MDIFQISIIDIGVGTVIGMLLGGFWYSSLAFGPRWMESIGKTTETLGSQTKAMIGSIVASLLTAIGVAFFSSIAEISSLPDALSLGAALGVLLIFPALLSDNLFCGWGLELLLIQSGYRVLSVVLMSVAILYV